MFALSQGIAYQRAGLAVHRFENRTGDEALDCLSSILSAWIRADLHQSKYIDIVEENGSRTRIMYILDGSFKKMEGNFLVSVRMRNARTKKINKTKKDEFTDLEEIPSFVDKLTPEVKTWLKLTPNQIGDDFDKEVGLVTTSSSKAFLHFLEGKKFLSKGDRKDAISSFLKAVEIDPAFALAHWNMGMAFPPMSLASYAKKKSSLLFAIGLSDRLSERAILELRGNYHAMTRYRYAKALEAYEKLLALYPDDDDVIYNMGLLYFDIEEWEKAASLFRDVVETAGENPAATLNLARAYVNPGLYDEAQKVHETYIRNFGDDRGIYLHLATVHRFKQKYDSALDIVDRAISLYPDAPSCYATKGDIYLYSGELDKAEAEYRKLVEHEKEEFQDMGLSRLSELCLFLGRFEESRTLAAQSLERIKMRDNKGVLRDRLSFLALLDSLAARPREALDKLDVLWKTTLEDEELEWQRFIVYRKGLVFVEMGRLDLAREEAKRLAGLIQQGLDEKKLRLYLHLMGAIELAKRNYRHAIDYLEKSLPLICIRSRLNIAVADSLASAYAGVGDLERARKQYERMSRFPRGRQFYGNVYAESFYHLGRIFEEQGQREKALKNYEKFLDLWKDADPGIPEVLDAQKRLKALS